MPIRARQGGEGAAERLPSRPRRERQRRYVLGASRKIYRDLQGTFNKQTICE